MGNRKWESGCSSDSRFPIPDFRLPLAPTSCPAVLAIELAHPASPMPLVLPTEQAAALVDAIAADLARLLPGVDEAGLALAAALFDPAQVLRPGWPVFAELAQLYGRERRTRDAPQVMAFGAAGGRMASPVLEPEPGFGGGVFLCAPFVLLAGEAGAARLGARMEAEFTERGLAGAAVTLFLNQALGLTIEHARYLTRHDLAALTAIQLDHAGMAPAWQLIEAALLSPEREESVEADTGQQWAYAHGGVRGGALGYAAWRRGPGAGADDPASALAEWYLRQRQYAGLLAAHGLPPRWVDAGAGGGLADAQELEGAVLLERTGAVADGSVSLHAHEWPELGVIGVSARDAQRVLAHAWPLAPHALADAYERLAREFGSRAQPGSRARLAVDENGPVVDRPRTT
jgi:hypothetical protein